MFIPPPFLLCMTGVNTPGSLACCTFYYTDTASRLLTDTTKKIDTQLQVAALMGTSVPGLPIRDCAKSCNSSVPKRAKVSTIDMMRKRIFERFWWVQGLGTLDLRVKCPYLCTHYLHRSLTSDFSISVQFFSIARKSRNSCHSGWTWQTGVDDLHNKCGVCVYGCVCLWIVCVCVCVCVCMGVCAHAQVSMILLYTEVCL